MSGKTDKDSSGTGKSDERSTSSPAQDNDAFDTLSSESAYRLFTEGGHDGVWRLDPEGRTTAVNQRMLDMLGYEIDQLLGRALQDFIDCEEESCPDELFSHDSGVYELRLNHSEGNKVWTMVRTAPILNDRGARLGTCAFVNDVTEQRAAEYALRTSEQRFRALAENTTDLVCLHEPDGRYLYVSPSVAELLGYEPEELLDRDPYTLFHPDDIEHIRSEAHAQALAGEDHIEVVYRIRKKNGEYTWFETATKPIFDDAQNVIQLQTSSRDISKRKKAEEELRYQALHDQLTGLPNRSLLNDRLNVSLARCRRNGTLVALLFCDLDSFKLVNDSLGHVAGDRVLVAVAERLSSVIREDDTIARFGGDEFVIVCEGLRNREEATDMVQRIRSAFDEPFQLGSDETSNVRICASIGLVFDDGSASPEDLLRDADTAMYEAKRSGRDGVVTFKEHFRTSARARLDTAAALSRAIKNNELTLHYQPEVRLSDRTIVAVEALIRWQAPNRGLLLPDHFIPIAEETGLISAIGSWVAAEASKQLGSWGGAAYSPDLILWINVSARQLTDTNWLAQMVDIASAAKLVAPFRLGIEVTESTLLRDAPKAVPILERLRSQGVHVAIDDFGVGYSSLAYLRHLPVDILKIDRSFVSDLGRDPASRAIIASIINLAHSLNLTTVAEGVETEAQLHALRELGCDLAQGFHLHRPMAAPDLANTLSLDHSAFMERSTLGDA